MGPHWNQQKTERSLNPLSPANLVQPQPDWATPPQQSPKAHNRQTRSSGSKAPLIGFLTIWKLTKAMLGSSLIGMGPLEMPVWGEPWGLSDTRLSLRLPCSSMKTHPPALSLPEPWPQLPTPPRLSVSSASCTHPNSFCVGDGRPWACRPHPGRMIMFLATEGGLPPLFLFSFLPSFPPLSSPPPSIIKAVTFPAETQL